MLTLFVLPLILAFAPAAVWAFRTGGLQRLWLLGVFALLALILAALVFSAVHSVPSVWRVVLYFLVFVGPSVLFTNAALTVASGERLRERALDPADRSVRWEPGRACGGLCRCRLWVGSVVLGS
jgi:hypothetical protein